MGRRLHAAFSTFRDAVEQVDYVLAKTYGRSLWAELEGLEGTATLPTEVAQPANFLLQFALTRLCMEHDIRPDAVVGHSAGEVAAAWAAGVYDLDTAARIAVLRGRHQASVAGRGGMLAVGLAADEAAGLVANWPGVSIAAVNDEEATTLAGNTAELDQVAAVLKEQKVFTKRLRVEVPYHSPVMDEITGPLVEEIGSVATRSAEVELYSSVTARSTDAHEWSGKYWAENIRQPVNFSSTVRRIVADGHNCFLELAPHPVLTPSLRAVAGRATVSVSLLNRREDEARAFGSALAELAVERVGRPPRGPSLRLPPMERVEEPAWVEAESAAADRLGQWANDDAPILGTVRRSASTTSYDTRFSVGAQPWLEGHHVQGLGAIVPAAVWIELLGLAAVGGSDRSVRLRDVKISQALSVSAQPVLVRIEVEGPIVTAWSRVENKVSPWRLHAAASATHDLGSVPSKGMAPSEHEFIDACALYEVLESKGLNYRDPFRPIAKVASPPPPPPGKPGPRCIQHYRSRWGRALRGSSTGVSNFS